MPSRASRAATEIAERLRAEGFSEARATAVQGWIGRGWLGSWEWAHGSEDGRGGSEIILESPDAYEIAALISCLPLKDRTDTNVVLARIVRGLSVTEEEIHAAFSDLLNAMYREVGMPQDPDADEDAIWDAAEAKADQVLASRRRPRTLKAWEPGLRSWAAEEASVGQDGAAESATKLLRRPMVPLLAALSADPGQIEAGIEALAAATGLLPSLRADATPDRGLTDAFHEIGKNLTAALEEWRTVATDITLDELAQARQLLLLIYQVTGVQDAVGVMEGRIRRQWDTMHYAAAGACLVYVGLIRRGIYDPDQLLGAFRTAVEAKGAASGAADDTRGDSA